MKFCVKSFGCSANIAEGEIIKGLLKQKNQVSEEDKAEVIVLNVCTVKGENSAVKQIKKAMNANPAAKIVITGCITKKLQEQFSDALFISTHNIDKVQEAIKTNQNFIKFKTLVKLGFPRVRENEVIGIIPISSGCPDACTYCSTKLIKGNLHSFPVKKILEEAEKFIKQGCRELWITAQDTTCYGQDLNTNLAKLLKKIIGIRGDFFIRIGMGHPRHLRNFWDEFVQVFRHPKVFKFLHLPIQSGNNMVLGAMKRNDSVENFTKLVSDFRKEFPDATISTDIIVGFPGETEEQFNDSLNLIKKIKPDVLNISRFMKRPGTPASFFEGQIDEKIKKDRSRTLTELHKNIALENNKKWIGWQGEILLDEFGKNDSTIGRNFAYKPVIIQGRHELGKKVRVKITEAKPHFLVGLLL